MNCRRIDLSLREKNWQKNRPKTNDAPDQIVMKSPPRQSTLAAIRDALEAAGVEFIAENGGGAGVRLKR